MVAAGEPLAEPAGSLVPDALDDAGDDEDDEDDEAAGLLDEPHPAITVRAVATAATANQRRRSLRVTLDLLVAVTNTVNLAARGSVGKTPDRVN
ncbi:hypothetical protein GCM10011594_18520 [Nakamurella endophytica]|uniref:Uncharacterized protein n=1 Tax=Nakamurella endophytica TaxID=1748367 RepID=A0A917WFH6_9ACTN|nr:hypothetical protein GCM10011594_18520 [Nakamurella endophytica]